jgi:hypothetical protein
VKLINLLLIFLLSSRLVGQSIPEIELCDEPEKVTLSITNYNPEYEYLWTSSQGLFQPSYGQSISFEVFQPNTYTVVLITAKPNLLCNTKSTFTFKVTSCKGWAYYAPNAVHPYGTFNNTWFPKTWNVIIEELTIWNRWGELIHDKVEPWDPGNTQIDVYTARVVYLRPPGIREIVFYRVTVVN